MPLDPEVQKEIDRIGPEGMKRLGTRIWIGIAVFTVTLVVLGIVLGDFK